jgi:hypothetical protein
MCGANRPMSRLYVSGRSAVCRPDSGRSAPTRRLITTECGSLGGSAASVCALARATHARPRVVAARAGSVRPNSGVRLAFHCVRPSSYSQTMIMLSRLFPEHPSKVPTDGASGLSKRFNRICDLLDCLVHTLWNFHASAFRDFLRAQCDDETAVQADGNDATLHSLPTLKSNGEGSALRRGARAVKVNMSVVHCLDFAHRRAC